MPVEIVDSDLIETAEMKLYGLYINRRHKFLICGACKIVLGDYYVKHMKNVHSLTVISLDQKYIQEALQFHGVHSSIPPTPSTILLEIQGLPTISCFSCPQCPMISPQLNSIQKHFRSSHPHFLLPTYWNTVLGQQFNNSNNKSWFQVTAQDRCVEPNAIGDIIANVYQSITKQTQKTMEMIDIRNVSPWLRVTQWHIYTKPYNSQDLCQSVQQPKSHEFPALKSAVQTFWDKSSALINHTQQLVLEKLNSPYPQKTGLSNTPFHQHQNHSLRRDTYIRPIIGLLAMLLRKRKVFKVTIPDKIQALVSKLDQDLMDVNSTTHHTSVFDVLLALWTRKWVPTADTPICDPTVIYLMIFTMAEDGSFLEPKGITNVIARLEYLMRLVFLQAMHNSPNVEICANELAIWYQEKYESTFNSLRALQHIASSIAYGTQSLPKVWWTDLEHHRSLLFHGHPIHFADFPAMFLSIQQHMITLWRQDVLCGTNLSVQYTHLYDDLANSTPGYSFVTDPRNKCFENQSLLMSAFLEDPVLYKRFITFNGNGVIRWNIPALRKWLADYARFQHLQLLLVNTATGSPSRGTEITALLRQNTTTSSMRNLVVLDKYIAIICTYQKTSALSGSDKCIPHALDAFSADLLVQDLAIARPFAEAAAFLAYHQGLGILELYQNHLFVNQDQLFTTPDITAGLEDITLQSFGIKLGVNDWRHVSTAFRRKICTRMDDLFEEDNLDTVQALQSGHSRQTENRVYALSADSLLGAPEDLLPLFLEASKDWQIACKLVPGGLGRSYPDCLVVLGPPLPTQVSLTPRSFTHPMLHELEAILPILRRGIHFVDAAIHQAKLNYGMEEIDNSLEITTRPLVNYDEEALKVLQKLVGNKDATWTSDTQQKSIMAAIHCRRDVISVMATGSGKTMVALIPSIIEVGKTTVIILPLVSLMSDYRRKLEAMGVDYEVFEGKPLKGYANLILISADSSKSTSWRHHATMLHQRKPIVRQVFDEAHIPLLSAAFRPALRDMYNLRFLNSQIILLSATLPLSLQPSVIEEFGLLPNFDVFRSSTNRPELQYIWREIQMEHSCYSAVIQYIQGFHWTNNQDRGLVFVPHISMGEYLAAALGCDFYRGTVPTVDNPRQDIYNSWVGGKHRVMICTSSFGAGNDYSHTRLGRSESPKATSDY